MAKRYVDPLLSDRNVLQSISPSLTAEEKRITAAYLQLELASRTPEKGLSKACIEALVTVVLREATPEQLVRRDTLHEAIVVGGQYPT